MDDHELAGHLDLANHHPQSTPEDIEVLCQKVTEFGFNSAFVNPCYVALAKSLLVNRTKVGTVVSFPLGQDTLNAKISAVNELVQVGADELDVVPNIGTLLTGDEDGFKAELQELVAVAHQSRPVIIKFIIETGLFDNLDNGRELVKKAAVLIRDSGADFVKICTGMGPRGASVKDVNLVRQAVSNTIKVKAAGGIDTRAEALALLAAGADRIGTSHAVKIISGL